MTISATTRGLRPGVCTSTTRPTSPFDGQVIYETDTDTTRVWDGTTWDVIGVGVFTSTTRPSSPYEGKLIYETDTDLVRVWNGSSWITVGATSPITAVGSATVATSQSTTSTSYTDLATVGPTVTITTGTTAIVWISNRNTNNSGNANNSTGNNAMSFAVSGATTIAAADTTGITVPTIHNTQEQSVGAVFRVTGLTAGSNTFTAKYRVHGVTPGTGSFYDRNMVVMAV